MQLELQNDEVDDLGEALRAFTKVLIGELAHTDQRQYRAMLREKARRFEALAKRLEGRSETQSAPSHG